MIVLFRRLWSWWVAETIWSGSVGLELFVVEGRMCSGSRAKSSCPCTAGARDGSRNGWVAMIDGSTARLNGAVGRENEMSMQLTQKILYYYMHSGGMESKGMGAWTAFGLVWNALSSAVHWVIVACGVRVVFICVLWRVRK